MPRTHTPRSHLLSLALVPVALVGLPATPTYAATTTTTFTSQAAIHGPVAMADVVSADDIALTASGTPTGSVYPAAVSVSDVPGAITEIDVDLVLSHSYPDDVDVLLQAPSGKTVVLMSDVGGATPASALHLGFSSAAVQALPDSGPLVSGVYAPTNVDGNDGAGETWPAPAPAVADPHGSLVPLLGDSPDGQWQLFVRDDSNGDGGAISGWSISLLTDAVPTPADTYPATLPVSGLTGTVADVDLQLHGLSWDRFYDLDLMLVGPDGRRAVVLSDVGVGIGYGLPGAEFTLDDEAASPMPATGTVVPGTYRPTNLGTDDDVFPAPAPTASGAGSALSVFDGSDPNGEWHLYAVTDATGHGTGGDISGGWSLVVTTTDPVTTTPAPAADTTAPFVVGSGPHGHRVRRGVIVTAKASEPLDPASLGPKTAYLVAKGSTRHVRAKVRYLATTRTVLIDPKLRLRADTTYGVVVTTLVRDTAGNRLDQSTTQAGRQRLTWRFTTR